MANAIDRQERFADRQRGGQLHQVEDVSFNFIIPDQLEDAGRGGDEPPTSPTVLSQNPPDSVSQSVREAATDPRPPRRTPNTSVKRRRLPSDPEPPPSYHLPIPPTTQRHQHQQETPATDARRSSSDHGSASARPSTASHMPGRAETPDGAREVDGPTEDLGTLPDRAPRESSSKTGVSSELVIEVEESPDDAPGSGRLRSVRLPSSTRSRQLLQEAMRSETEEIFMSSSPLERKVRRSQGRASSHSERGSSRPSARTTLVDEDEPDDDTTHREPPLFRGPEEPTSELHDVLGDAAEQAIIPESPRAADSPELLPADATEPSGRRDGRSPEEPDHAEEITDRDAARIRPGHRRPQRSPRRPLRDPSSESERQSADEHDEDEPSPKRRRRHEAAAGPSKQAQPRRRNKAPSEAGSQAKPPSRGKKKPRKEGDDKETSSFVAQTFSRRRRVAEDDPEAEDVLQMHIPFSNRKEVHVVDVLSQVLEEEFGAALDEARKALQHAEDAPTRKVFKVKIRAIIAFREELRTRLLQHIIQLDAHNAFKKRIKKAEKKKADLREEVMRMLRERDQVWQNMESIRAKHQKESTEARRRLDLSTAMHDIDVAVERGKVAPEPTGAEQKAAALASLEAHIAALTDHVCSRSARGGVLKTVRDFNAFLERAAHALEHKQ